MGLFGSLAGAQGRLCVYALGSSQGGEIAWLDPWEMSFTLHLWKFYKLANSQIGPCPSPSPSKPNFLAMGLGCGDGGFPS